MNKVSLESVSSSVHLQALWLQVQAPMKWLLQSLKSSMYLMQMVLTSSLCLWLLETTSITSATGWFVWEFTLWISFLLFFSWPLHLKQSFCSPTVFLFLLKLNPILTLSFSSLHSFTLSNDEDVTAVTDSSGNTLRIRRDTNRMPVRVVAPDNQVRSAGVLPHYRS